MITKDKKNILPENQQDLIKQLEQWKKKEKPSLEEIKSIISQITDPLNKLIAEKILLNE